MKDEDLIIEIQEKILSIYNKEKIYPLRGKDDSYEIDGKSILTWHSEVTRHCWCHNGNHFNFDQNIDDLLYISDELVYFTAHLFLYLPYISTPLKDAYSVNGKTIFPAFYNLERKRYDMYLNVAFEKVYNYWDRIGDLIASFFPQLFKGNIYFNSTINKLESEFADNEDFQWLLNFCNFEYINFNSERIQIVHYISQNTNTKWEQLGQTSDLMQSTQLTDKIISYPNYFKKMNEDCKIGFVKTLNFLEYVNLKLDYKCPDMK